MLILFSKMDKRSFLLSVVGAIVILSVVAITYLVVPEIRKHRSLSSNLELLQMMSANKSDFPKEITALSKEVNEAKKQLSGDMANLPDKEMESYIIGVLQNISWNNNIKLIGVKPSIGNEIHIFQEVLYDVELTGDYFDLYSWFLEIRKSLGFIVIKKLNLSPLQSNSSDTPLLVDLTISSYKSINQ